MSEYRIVADYVLKVLQFVALIGLIAALGGDKSQYWSNFTTGCGIALCVTTLKALILNKVIKE